MGTVNEGLIVVLENYNSWTKLEFIGNHRLTNARWSTRKSRPQRQKVECICTKPRATFRFADGIPSFTDRIVRKNVLTVTELIVDNTPHPPQKKYRDENFMKEDPWEDMAKMGRENHEGLLIAAKHKRMGCRAT